MKLTHGFELIDDQHVAEFNMRARLWRHTKTGAELLSLENDDENKVFSINFRTPWNDSTGVAHIMEHSVLCGSQKYPVKEPFVELLKGSLNTFLNAFTYPDKTCYPVASTNLQDFYNLIDVYLDAVLHPLISPYTLMQEGWHYELDTPDGEISYKGVVFNEMKGAYSSPDGVMEEKSKALLFPDTPYAHDSGGNPENIPDLTYAQFKKFHEDFYHPSNARIFFYGDDDPEERLRLIDAAFRGYSTIKINTQVPLQPTFANTKFVREHYESSDDPQAKAQVTVNWMLPEVTSLQESLGLHILEHIIIGTPASPLRKALIDSGLGEDLAGVGLEANLRQMMVSIGLKGIEDEDAAKVEALVVDTLNTLAEDGIDSQTVAASLNTVEFALRENNTGSFPRGLALMLNVLEEWNYDRNPIDALAFETPLNAIKSLAAEGHGYFEGLIRKYLLDNPHRVTLLLLPDAELGTRRAEAEQKRLEQARAKMSPVELSEIIETTSELHQRQENADTPEALATIPMLKRDDLDKTIKLIPIDIQRTGESTVLFHDLFTNGIVYVDLGFNLRALPQEHLPYVPVFSRALLETGTTDQNFVELMQRIGQRTGGIHPAIFTSASRKATEGAAWLFIRGKAMVSQTSDLLNILKDVLYSARLHDRERIRQIVLEEKSGMEAGLTQAGHRVVNSRLKARYSQADWAAEEMGGISQLFFLRNLLQQIDQNWAGVQDAFEEMRTLLLRQPYALCNATVDSASWNVVRGQMADFLGSLPVGGLPAKAWQPSSLPSPEGLTVPSQVNFVGKGTNLYTAGYQLHGSAFVITPYLRGTYMWDKIRVQGGAYGGFSVFDQHSGAFNYLSYRDPNLDRTLTAYDQAGAFLRSMDISESELTKAIIGAIGEIDAYQLPDAKGYTSLARYLLGINDEERQRLRDEVLTTSPADFRNFGEVLEAASQNSAVVVLGSADAVENSQLKQGGKLEVKKVL
ncbi:MAG: insulinase family protein [Bellilinea sp.]